MAAQESTKGRKRFGKETEGKTLMVKRSTEGKKQTLQEGRGKQRGCCLLYCKLQEQIQQHFHQIQLLLKPLFFMTVQARCCEDFKCLLLQLKLLPLPSTPLSLKLSDSPNPLVWKSLVCPSLQVPAQPYHHGKHCDSVPSHVLCSREG